MSRSFTLAFLFVVCVSLPASAAITVTGIIRITESDADNGAPLDYMSTNDGFYNANFNSGSPHPAGYVTSTASQTSTVPGPTGISMVGAGTASGTITASAANAYQPNSEALFNAYFTVTSSQNYTLDVLNGGQVTTSDNVIIGNNSNSRGEVVVDGIDSTLEITGTIDVSSPGQAKLTVSNGGLVSTTGVFRVGTIGELWLDGGRVQSSSGTGLSSHGLVRGGGTVAAPFTNNLAGEIRVAWGDELVLRNSLTTAGLITLNGGELEVLGATTNTGDIDIRNGTIRFQGGLANNAGAQLAIVGGEVDVFGVITNATTGQVVVGGEAHAAFHDTFTNNGLLLITPGSELLTLENLSFGSGSEMTIQIAGSDPNEGFGQVLVADTAGIAGTLNIELAGDFIPTLGETFQILTAGSSRAGTFATEVLPSLGSGLDWDVTYNPKSIVLSVISAPGSGIIGDYNDDGAVNAADYILWRKYNGTSTTLPNDLTPGTVNASDYTEWRISFGQISAGSGSESSNVPEPSIFALLVFGLLQFGFTRGGIQVSRFVASR